MQDLLAPPPAAYITAGDIARIVQVDLKTIHNWVRLGHLRGPRTKGGHLRFHRTEVVRFLRQSGRRVPEFSGHDPPQVMLVGFTPGATPLLDEDMPGGCCAGLFDAALAVAAGEYEVVAFDLDQFDVTDVQDLMLAMDRRPLTQGVALLGVSARASVRQYFVEQGGDVALASEHEIAATVCWVTGTPAAPAAASSVRASPHRAASLAVAVAP